MFEESNNQENKQENNQTTELQFKDNSRLSEFKLCPRKYWFHYVQHIVPGYARYPLDFGSAWHKAMDYVFIQFKEGQRGTELSRGAFKAFLQDWTSRGHPAEIPMGDEKNFKARTPATAREMLAHYINTRSEWLEKIELVSVERPFAVPLDPDNPNRFYVGRLDKVIKESGFYWVIEHKTNSLYSIKLGMQTGFTESFDPNSQVDGYSFALKIIYGSKSMGVMIDAALVHKTYHDIFKFIPINKGAGFANDWLRDANYWWDRVDDAKKNNHYPKTAPGGCRTVYGACEYKNICLYTRKEEDFDEAPSGFKIEKWEPFSFDELQDAVKISGS